MVELKNKVSAFFDGYLFPVFIALIVFIGHTFSLEAISLIIIVLSTVACSLLCEDLRAIISPLLMATFTISYKSFLDGWLNSTFFLILCILSAIALVASFVAHFVIYKKLSYFKTLKSSALFWGIIALSASFLLNGLFNIKEYKAINIIFALLLVLSLAIVYFLFYAGLQMRHETTDYLIYILYVASVLLIAEMLVLLLRDATFDQNGAMIKESLILGWGVWNNIGGMLTMLLPIHFYYASTKKNGYVFYASAILTYVMIILTLSRSSLLFSTIIAIICVIVICAKGENVRINRIISISLAFVTILGIIIFWSKISSILTSYLSQGFGDNGRFSLYKHGFENFLSNPILGGGFGSCAEDYFGHGIEPNRYHNTIIEMLATCGIVGLGAYVFHRYQVIRLFWSKRKDLFNLFLIISISALLLTSLLDNHFFNFYPTMYYSITLCVMEKCSTKSDFISENQV